MAYDDIFPYLGEFGPYQKRIYYLLCLIGICNAFHKLGGVFLQAKMNHRCRLPFEEENVTYNSLPEEKYNMTYPWDSELDNWSSCQMLKSNFSPEYFSEKIPSDSSVDCDSGWVYDTTKYKGSTVKEWDLVCGNTWLRATADSVFMLGDVIGCVTFGFLSDKYGRRPIFFLALSIQLTAGFLVAVSPIYLCFMILRLLVASSSSGQFLVAYVIGLEMVGPSKRIIASVVCMMFFTLGYVLTAALAYFITDWRKLQVAFTSPALLFISYWWVIPESSRWLLSNGRIEEAKANVLKAAKGNKTEIPEEILENLLEEEKKDDVKMQDTQEGKATLLDLIRYPNLRKRILMFFFNWFANNCTYFGLAWNTSNLGGNDYLNFFIAGAVEIPAYTFLLLTLNKWGRKPIFCGSMLVGGTALFLTLFVPADANWLFITLAMIGKLAVTSSFGSMYIFTAEQIPTVIRNVAIGASGTCAGVGGIMAPYINLLADFWKPLPLVVFGLLISAGGIMSLQLPETLNKKLPDTLEEGEEFGKRR